MFSDSTENKKKFFFKSDFREELFNFFYPVSVSKVFLRAKKNLLLCHQF